MSLVHEHWRKKEEILPLLIGEEENESQRLYLKPLPVELKYAFLEENKQCPVIISSLLSIPQEDNLLQILKSNKQALGWKISDLKGISPTICTHHIYLEEKSKVVRQPHRRLNPHMQEVVCIEVLKLLQVGIIYPISDSTWVCPTQVVPKKSGVTIVQNEKGEEMPTRLTTGWRVCIDYRRLNEVTRKDHFPLPFMDQLLERVSGHPSTAFWMVIQATSRLKLLQTIRTRLPSPALLAHMPTGGCLSACVMPLPHSSDVCLVFSVIW